MNSVTTGIGVSGAFADTLETLVGTIRANTGNPGWHIHMQALQIPKYSLRVYSPDRHSQQHTVTMTMNAARDIGEILVNEAKLWQKRIKPALKVADDSKPG